jgi:DNA repair exonuclease SbcCD ATPase subunit
MRNKSLFYRLTLGLLIGALIMPAQPARAQWPVYDGVNHKTQIQKRIEDARRHVQTFDNAVKQYTTLRGVLGKAEELVTNQFISKETMKEIGITVRSSLQLKDHAQAIISTRLKMLKSIDDRLRNGIFDPEADLRDLEDYLRTSIGRSSQDSIATLERLEKMDNTLERMRYELKKAQSALAEAHREKKGLEIQLNLITSRPESQRDGASVGSLIEKISNCEVLISNLNRQIEELQTKINERAKKYHVLMDERIKFGEQVGATNEAWTEFNKKLEEIEKSLRYF